MNNHWVKMDKNVINVKKVIKHSLFTHPCFRERGWKTIALVTIGFHEIDIVCPLIEGQSKNEKFYFLDLPNETFFNKTKNQWFKKNKFNFSDKKESDEFQKYSFDQILHDHPDLFSDSYLEFHKNIFENKKNKARNKSKFEKE